MSAGGSCPPSPRSAPFTANPSRILHISIERSDPGAVQAKLPRARLISNDLELLDEPERRVIRIPRRLGADGALAQVVNV